MRQIVGSTAMPDIGIGRHCNKPYECPFYAHCWQKIDGWTIYDIPYLKRPYEKQFETEGIRYVVDIPVGVHHWEINAQMLLLIVSLNKKL